MILVDLYASLSRFFCYPDPDQRFLKWIRIRPNDTDPTGSETLLSINNCKLFLFRDNILM